MRIAYLDCFSGVAGDMLLGALIDAGLNPDELRSEIAKLRLDGVEFRGDGCVRQGITGIDVKVEAAHDHAHRHLSTIERIISDSSLDESVKTQSQRVFRRLGEAEAAIQGIDIEKVHFHEVGAIDAIVDIVGACIGFEKLGIDEIHCSPLNLGSGTVKAAHGVMPVPAPATGSLVKGLPAYSDGPAVELTTPTGAAIVSTLATGFGPMPAMSMESIGYGAGDKDFKDRANMLRIVVGESVSAPESTEIWIIEANIDDMTPEMSGFARSRLLEEGALDVTVTPTFMKKGRPGFTLSVLTKPEDRDRVSDVVFAETTTLGVRTYSAQRRVLERTWRTVSTDHGDVRIKVAGSNFAPEYEDCAKLAREKGVPFKQVWQQANHAYLSQAPS